ncbi:MAG: T9SS type A sorting domain-containing protein, partial [Candidatus Krumholzibacteria bacterium]|nr:T9SS type A sorting domain-containing protein [Candidatus Krumholzibacteria bacterium]
LYLDDPGGPVVVGFFNTADYARRVAASATTVYLADNDDGVYVLDFDPPPTAVTIQALSARVTSRGVEIEWDIHTDETLVGFDLFRRSTGTTGEVGFVRLGDGGHLSPNRRSYLDPDVIPGHVYQYRLEVVTSGGGAAGASRTVTVKTLAHELELFQNTPNPFNPITHIRFTVDRDGPVAVRVFDVTGRLVRTLVDRPLPAGSHAEGWDGRDTRGNVVASGVYYIRLESDRRTLTRKAVLLR